MDTENEFEHQPYDFQYFFFHLKNISEVKCKKLLILIEDAYIPYHSA